MKHEEKINEIYLNGSTWSYGIEEGQESPLRRGEKIQAFKDVNSNVVIRFSLKNEKR